MGGTVDTTPSINGDGRMSIAPLLGFQPEVEGMRFQLLGEAGRHRFSDVGGGVFGHQLGPDTWLPYLGVRLGVARTVPAHGLFELGAWLFGRDRHPRGDRDERERLSWARRPGPTIGIGGWMWGLALRSGCAWRARTHIGRKR